MKHFLQSRNPLHILILIGLFTQISASSQVTHRDTLVTWSHFDFTLDENNGMDWYSTTNIVDESYPGIVLENEYVRLVILPGFGARILSFLYKPTGHEQFYTNPVGTPYGMGDGNFYYDWLMVFGGVFPTFPEPEHGKTWFLSWQWELTEVSEDRISLKMEIQDTINYPAHPGKFNNGVTEVRCISTVTLEKGKTAFELEHMLQNTKAQTVTLEYWTCTTLAPGSEVGNTFSPGTSEIIAPIEYVYLKDDWWSWMGTAETPAPQMGSHVFNYKNLAIYDNWDDMGIAYAYPSLTGSYYGVVNHENSEGVFRIANNAEITPGMKFWTWGEEQGANADPENFFQTARPYIELWSGLSTQFFEDAYLSAGETVSWTETYLPTVAMDAFSNVNQNGAINLGTSSEGDDHFLVDVFMVLPDSLYDLTVTLNGNTTIDLFDESFVAQSTDCNSYSFYIDEYSIEDGEYQLMASVSDMTGETVLESSIPVTVPFPAQGINFASLAMPKIIRMSANVYKLEFTEPMKRTLTVFTVNGNPVDEMVVYDQSAFVRIEKPGIYVIRVMEGGVAYSVKVVIN